MYFAKHNTKHKQWPKGASFAIKQHLSQHHGPRSIIYGHIIIVDLPPEASNAHRTTHAPHALQSFTHATQVCKWLKSYAIRLGCAIRTLAGTVETFALPPWVVCGSMICRLNATRPSPSTEAAPAVELLISPACRSRSPKEVGADHLHPGMVK